MERRSKSILRPPAPKVKSTPLSEAIAGYMKAIDEECRRILLEEGITNKELHALDNQYMLDNKEALR